MFRGAFKSPEDNWVATWIGSDKWYYHSKKRIKEERVDILRPLKVLLHYPQKLWRSASPQIIIIPILQWNLTHIPWVALHHLVGGFETFSCDLTHSHPLMESFGIRHNGGVGCQREVDARVGHKVGLEFCEVHVESAVETEGGGDGRYHLGMMMWKKRNRMGTGLGKRKRTW